MSAHVAVPTAVSNVRVRTQDSPSVDAFGRWRVSNNHILLSGQLNHADNALVWDTSTATGATTAYTANESAMTMTVTGTSGSSAIRQTKRYWLYRAGQSHKIAMTFADGDPVANVRKRLGYFDADNGIFLEVTSAAVSFVRRSFVTGSAVDDAVAQAAWNLDKLDGTGASGLTLDLTKSQQMHIDLQWLGVGRVRIGFDIDGVLIYAHEFDSANILAAVPYMSTGSLPIRYEITSTAASAGATLVQICSAVIREGGDEEEGYPTCLRSSLITPLTATTTPRSAVSVRLKSTHVRAFAKPLGMTLLNLDADRIAADLVLNPTLAGGPLLWTDIGQSLEQSITQLVYTPGSGHQMGCIVTDSTNQNKGTGKVTVASVLGVASNIAGTSDVLSVIVEGDTVAARNLAVILQMLELF